MQDEKVIDITHLLKQKLQDHNHVKDVEEYFEGGLFLKFEKTSATFTMYFENSKGEVLDISPAMVEEVIYRMFEVIEVLQKEFQLDL